MTIDEAVRILNTRRHRDHHMWYVNCRGQAMVFLPPNDSLFLTPTEAIAVAEYYVRNPPPLHETTPVPGWLVVRWVEYEKRWCRDQFFDSQADADRYVSRRLGECPEMIYRVVRVTEAAPDA